MTRHVECDRFLSGDREARAAATAHVLGCPSCRSAIAEEDPTRLFSLLAARALPEELLDEVSDAVASHVRRETAPIRFAAPRIKVAAWFAAAVVVAVAMLVLTVPRGPVKSPAQAPVKKEEAVAGRGVPRAGFELLSPQGDARVVDLTVGDTQVVMIFDKRLDL